MALAVVVFVIILINNFNKPKVAHEKALVIVQGKFAFCGASSAKATGNTITVEGKEFLEGVAACPVMDGFSIANIYWFQTRQLLQIVQIKPYGLIFGIYDSVPQAPSWETLPTANRTFTIGNTPETSMSNMWCMPCKYYHKELMV